VRRLLSFLGVHADEGRSSLLMIAHSFCMGTSTVFFETAASALFLSQFESQALPWVYVAAALLNVATGAVYSWLKERVSFSRLMTGTLAFLFVSACAFRLGLGASSSAKLVFAALVFYRVLSILTDLEYWAVAARLYDVRQAKRLFGLIGTGEVVARILGAFSVPFFVRLMGVANLIWVSAAGLLACALLVVPALRLIPEQDAAKGDEKRPARGAVQQLQQVVGDRYLLLVTGIAGLAVLGKHFVDFAFLEQLRARFDDASALAGFFGVFSGLTQGLSLLARLLVSGPLLQRYGIRVGLLVLPLTHLLCTLLIVVNASLGDPHRSALVFWLVIANQGIYKTLKHPIDNPSFKVLYQPLRAEKRLAAQIGVEVVFAPVALGLAGGIMLLMSTVVRYDPVRFAYVLLVNFALWALVARLGSRAYQGALLEVLRRRVLDDAPFALNDGTSVALLRARLDGRDEADVLFALQLLEKAEYARIREALLDRLDHPAARVRRYVLERLAARGEAAALDAVRRRVLAEQQPGALAAGLRALAALGGVAQEPLLARFVRHPDAAVRRGALAGLLSLADPGAEAAALRRLAELARSGDVSDRLLAAQALADRSVPAADATLRVLLHDGEPVVRRTALVAARGCPVELLPLLIENLGHPAYAGAAAAALAAGGEAVVSPLIERFSGGGRRSELASLLGVLGQIGGARAIAFLRSQLDYPDQNVRSAAIAGLLRRRFAAVDDAERAAIFALLRQEAADAAFKLASWRDLPEAGPWPPLREALQAELELLRRRCFELLSFVYERDAVLRAQENVRSPARQKRAYAVEVLDVTLDGALKGPLLPLLDDRPLEARLPALLAYFPQPRRAPAERVRDLLARPDRSLRPWTRACAVRAAAGAGLRELKGELASLHSADPLLRQATAAAIQRLEGEPQPNQEGSAPMLLIEKVMILKGVQIFEDTAEEILAEIAAALEEVCFKAGETIFLKGDAGDSMYVIVEGQVRVSDGERTINVLGEREIFGELALLDPEPRSASCAAVGDARLFRLDAETFSQLMAGNIEIVRGVLHVLCGRLRRVTSFVPTPR
jgi:hypothetical protein